MTVWVVTLNGFVRAVCHDADEAATVMEAEKARHNGPWREVGHHAWSAPNVTSLARRPWTVGADA